MQGDYYAGPNPLMKGTLSSIERERLREKEKEARAQMTFEAEQRETPDINTPLFGELVRVNPRVDDKDSLQIQKKLGKFDNVKHLLADQGVGNLFGIDAQPPPSPAPCPPIHSSGSSRLSGISAPTPEFKKPTSAPPTSSRSHHHHHHQSTSSSQRGGFVKPSSEGKQAHSSRGSYQSQAVKHSSNSYRSSNINSTKGPSTSSSSSSSTYSSSRLHQSARNLPKLNTENRDGNNSTYFSNSTTQDRPQANVENILDEMTMLRTPLTGIAATPRKEMESKFTFDRNLEKIVSLSNNKKPYEKVGGTKENALNRILGPARSKKALCSPVYKSSGESPTPISKTPGHNTTPVPSPSNNKPSIVTNQAVSSFSTTIEQSSSTLPKSSPRLLLPTSSYLKDLSLSEDSSSCDSGSEDTPHPPPPPPTAKSIVTSSQTSITTPSSDNNCTNSRVNGMSVREMSPKKETVLSSSSEDSDSESDSEGSSSDSTPSASPSPSPSTSSVTRPSTTTVNTTPETENQHRWNLNTILRKLEKPPTPEAAPTQIQQTNQGTGNNNSESKSADDSDSCSSDSSHKSDSSSGSSSSDSDSDAEEEEAKNVVVETKEPPSVATMTVVDDEATRNSTTEVSKSPFVNGSKSATTAATSAIIGVVKPHQRRPPSPELNWRADMDYGVARRLPNEDVSYGRSMLTDSNIPMSSNVLRLQEQKRQMLGLMPNMAPIRQVHRSIGSGQRNNMQPMLSSTTQNSVMLAPPPQQKRRGRKRTVRPPSSESESENPPVVAPRPERRRGRPPTKRPAGTTVRNPPISRLVTQNTNPIVEKYRTTNLWDAELANGYPSNLDGLDSDSEDDSSIIPPKPTARVVPAMNRRDYRADLYSINNRSSNNFRVPTPGSRTRNDEVFNPLSRNISGRSTDNYMPLSGASTTRNEYNNYSISVPGSTRNRDFSDSSSLCGNSNVDDSPPKLDVEGIAVQDKKKSDTLRKLFSRREEGGGKGGGKGKGGKGKCGVIVVDGEQDRRLSDRSHSPTTIVQERSNNVVFPSLSYNSEGKPSLKCTIQLSKISLPLPAIKEAKEQTNKGLGECNASNTVPPSTTFQSNVVDSRHDKKKEHRSSSSRKKKSKKSKRRSISPLKVVPQTPQTERRDTCQIMLTNSDQSTVRYDHISVLTCYDGSNNNRMKNNANINDNHDQCAVVDNNDNRNNHPSSSSSSASSYRTNCYNRTNEYHSNTYQHRHITSSDSRRKINHLPNNNLVVGTREDKIQDQLLTDEDDLMDGTSGRSIEQDNNSYDEGESTTGTVTNNSVGIYSNGSPNGENYGLVGTDDTFERQPMVVHSYYSYLEQRRLAQERNVEAANISPNVYLLQAKRLKHAADEMEEDQIAQGMQYLEAILSFLLTGHALEARSQLDTAHSMFSETLKLIVYISRKFRSISSLALEPSIPIKIAILSLRCESLLNVKLFSMNVGDAMETYQKVSEYVNMAACTYETEEAGVVTQCSPHSPSPSPASSSGYSSSSSDRHNVFLPVEIFTALKKQATFHKILLDAFDYWKESDNLIYKHQTEGFFIELDRHCGQLTLHSSLIDLVDYVRDGIQRLKQLIASNNVPTANR